MGGTPWSTSHQRFYAYTFCPKSRARTGDTISRSTWFSSTECLHLQDSYTERPSMDIWDKKKRSAVMARIKSKDTKPELIVRRYLWSRGYRYRKNMRGLPGTPDIVLRKYRVVIFVHGCFWHGHEADGTMPHTRTEFWRKKIEQNKARDERNKEALKNMGWNVLTIWECQLKPAVRAQTLLEVEYWINHAYLERFRQKPAKPYETIENSPGVAAEGSVEYGKELSGQENRK